ASAVVEDGGDRQKVVYNRTRARWPVWDRDAVLKNNVSFDAAEARVRIEFSTVQSDKMPPQKGVVRMPYLRGHWYLWPETPTRTRWYTGDPTYDTLLAGALIFAAFVFAVSWFLPSPYGRFASARFGLSLDPRLGWFLMELPATLSFLWFYWHGPRRLDPVPLLFLAMWLVHYGNRGFYFPLHMRVARGDKSSFSFVVIGVGWVVTSLHGYFHAT